MRAIILAAGKGERLLPLTRNCPKSLLEVSDGQTLLESQLQSLLEAGIEEVKVVVGYKAEQIESKIKGLSNPRLSTIFNPFFATTNNLVSAWLATPYLENEFLLINGDDIFKSDVIRSLLGAKGDITMVVDRKPSYDEDDMKAITDGDRVLDVGKDIEPKTADAEAIGITKFSPLGAQIFRDVLDNLVRHPDNHGRFYLYAYRHIMRSGYDVRLSECLPTDWAEVDFHQDLTDARSRLHNTLRVAMRRPDK